MTLTDALGNDHAPVDVQRPPRIVSLVPSLTELLCDLGRADWIVGRTGFCIHPAAAVAGIPKVGGTKDVNIAKLLALAPTHLIVNIDENEKPTVDLLAQQIPHVIVTHPLAPSDNLPLYRLFGAIFQCQAQAEQLCAAFHQARTSCHEERPQRVLYCIWKDPWMTVSRDTYIARMLDMVGWRQWTSAANQSRYPQFVWDDALTREVDLILLSSEPYRFTAAHGDALARQVGKPVVLIDGEMLSWYGSRAIAGMRYLSQLRRELPTNS